MCQAAKPVRRVTLFEGQVKFIMERDTPEERLAAIETIFAIAFPPDEEHKYVPPALPTDGSKLSPCDRVRRDVYNFLKDVLEKQAEKDIVKKDPKKAEAGRLGALARFGDRGSSSCSDAMPPKTKRKAAPVVPKPIEEDDFEGYESGSSRNKRILTASEKAEIAAWDEKIPDAKALQEYLKQNYMYQNKSLVITDSFCELAYQKLAKIDRWISTKDRRPLHDIRHAIHYIALDYIKTSGQIRRVEKEERQKDMQADFSDGPDYAAKVAEDRKRMKQLEREAAKKGQC